jgi:hypothetical protein
MKKIEAFYYQNHKSVFHCLTLLCLGVLMFFTGSDLLFSTNGLFALMISNLICTEVIYKITKMDNDVKEYFEEERKNKLKDF